MGRSGYGDDLDTWALIRWRGAVNSAIRGERGQAFLRELVGELDALPEPRLIAGQLERANGEVCALGCVLRARGLPQHDIDPHDDTDILASRLNIAEALVREIEYLNDELHFRSDEERFSYMRKWAAEQLEQGDG